MTRTERSKFRAHCKSEAQRFDMQDTPVTRALRAERKRQAKSLRVVRIMIYLTIAGVIAMAADIFYKF